MVNRGTEIIGKTFDYTNEDVFPVWVRTELSKPGPYNDKTKQWLMENGLVFCEVVLGNSASDRICRAMYSGGFLGWGDVDNWIGNRGQGAIREAVSAMQALINRLEVCSKWIADFLTTKYRNRQNDEKRFVIKDLGAGCGSYAFRTLDILRSRGEIDLNWIDWQCLEIAEDAICYGTKRLKESPYEGIISFNKCNFLSQDSYPENPDERGDLTLLIGIICAMSVEQSENCLQKIVPHTKEGSSLLITTLSSLAFEENPKMFRVLVNLGWGLQPKTYDEVVNLVNETDWAIKWTGSERRDLRTGAEIPGEYIMVHGVLQ